MKRKYPIGAEIIGKKGVHFRVWCPSQKSVDLILIKGKESFAYSMKKEKGGYFSLLSPHAKKGTLYLFKVGEQLLADPASRHQPWGTDGPSCVIDTQFPWKDQTWKGLTMKGQSIYEIHIGTYTKEGTFPAAQKHLKEIATLGIKTILLMPLHTFPGRFGWGYDGVSLFAPMHTYGTPDEVKAFVNQAHQLGLGVILDVVYNHLGPENNQLVQFSKNYLSEDACDWGSRMNFDSLPVREYCLTNAIYWIEEYHFDGLRFDASSWLISKSGTPILTDFSKICKRGQKPVILIAENEPQNSNLLLSFKEGGNQFDGMLNDDFHHTAHVRLTGNREAYYTDYFGTPQEFISSLKYGFLYQGQYYHWQKQNRGVPHLQLKPESFVIFLDNHDQIANSIQGKRLHQLSDPGNYKAMVALLLLGPNIPMIFQGQEFSSSKPFHYFADHSQALNQKITRGRIKFLNQFPRMKNSESHQAIPLPSDIHTFERCKIDFKDRKDHEQTYRMFKDLLHLRNHDPVFKDIEQIDGSVLGPDSFLLRFFGIEEDRLLIINFGPDLHFDSCPDPLIAAGKKKKWKALWSSELAKYGGEGCPPFQSPKWKIAGHSAMVLKPA